MEATTTEYTLEEIGQLIDMEFDNIVGQERPKSQVKRLLMTAYAQKGFLKPMFIQASFGGGKTKFVRAIHSLVKIVLNRKRIWFESGEECGTPSAFFTEYAIPHIHNSDSVLFIDEFHKAQNGIHGIILNMLDPTVEREIKVVKRPAGEVVYNPMRNSIVVATNRVNLIDPALKSRFEVIILEMYTDEQLSEILSRALSKKEISFEGDGLLKVSQCNRGTARNIVNWFDAITGYASISGRNVLTDEDVSQLIKEQGVFPMGITENELRTLLLIESYGPLQLKELADKQNISSTEQNDNEKYLRRRHFITVEVKRMLTAQGHNYLASLREGKFIAPRNYAESCIQL